MLRIGLLLFAMTLSVVCGQARAEALRHGDLSTCGEPCFIQTNPGGRMDAFIEAAEHVRTGARKQVIIGWLCSSACAIFADFARPRVCILPSVEFGFHKAAIPYALANGKINMKREDTPQSADILAWIKAQGGEPEEGLLVMKYEQALRFWPKCRGDQLPAYMTK